MATAESERELNGRAAALDAREAELARREAAGLELAARIVRERRELRTLAAQREQVPTRASSREAELERQVSELEAEVEHLRARVEALSAAAAVEGSEPAPLQAAPARRVGPMPTPAQLEDLVARSTDADPDRAEDWRLYLFHLREYVAADGTIPASFSALVDDVFGDLVHE